MSASNASIVAALRQLVAYTQLEDGQSQSFRTRAYEKAIDAINARADDISGMSVDQLKQIEGIGDSTARKIVEFSSTGSIGKVDRLKQRFPPTMLELLRIPGLGPKTVLTLQDHLGITDIGGLRDAIAREELRTLPGLGKKSEEKIAEAIELLGIHSEERRTPIFEAMGIASRVLGHLGRSDAIAHAEYAGSLRRLSETIGDIDILVVSTDPPATIDDFVALPGVTTVLGSGTTKASIVVDDTMQVDLRVVPEESLGAALLYFTGSKGHNIALRQRALERGWTLNEYTLSDLDTGAAVASASEGEIYAALGLPWIAPELREDTGEVAAGDRGTLPEPLTEGDIRGDLHVHTDWSGDGRSTMTAMLDALEARGMEYVALTDHGEDLAINGLSRARVMEEKAAIELEREQRPGLVILHGAELNIGPDGTVDYDPDFLDVFDFTVASIHSHFDLDEAQQTSRLLTAMDNPAVSVIGHPSGRKIGHRPGVRFDADVVFAAAAATGTALEINCHLQRLDLAAPLIRKALDHEGLMFAISTDAHHVSELANLKWGVAQARKGWVPRNRVLNSLPMAELSAFLARKRPA